MKLTTAKVARTLSIAALALAGLAAAQADLGTALQLQSDKKLGYVTLNSDLVLNQGRLVITVGAFNKGMQVTELSQSAIAITTASGKPVPLASLAQLEDETRVALGGKPVSSPDNYQQMSAMQRPVDTTASGERDVSGYTGGDTLGSSVSTKSRKKAEPGSEAKIKEAVDNLHLAILQKVSVEPRAAAGGQVVTQSFKFARGEPRKLKMTVDFAGEQHEFEFEVPK